MAAVASSPIFAQAMTETEEWVANGFFYVIAGVAIVAALKMVTTSNVVFVVATSATTSVLVVIAARVTTSVIVAASAIACFVVCGGILAFCFHFLDSQIKLRGGCHLFEQLPVIVATNNNARC